jgi:hypothetical protein
MFKVLAVRSCVSMVVGACLFAIKLLLMLEAIDAVASAKRGMVRLRDVAVTIVKAWLGIL